MKTIGRILFKALLCLLLFSVSVNGLCQTQEIRDAISSIAKTLLSPTYDATSVMLKEAGFVLPENLQSNWNQFSAYRKIETAYWAAEKSGHGDVFIASLTQKLGQQFESVNFEKSLERFANLRIEKLELKFASITSLELPSIDNLPVEIKSSLLTITKYSDAKALGGTKGILQYYFGLNDNDVFSILRESNTNIDALLQGINKASIPPTQKERIKKIVGDLQETFEAAKLDEQLSEILDRHFTLEQDKPVIIAEESHLLKPSEIKATPQFNELDKRYHNFIKETHTTLPALKFEKMILNPEGFGGVILGNKFKTSKLKKLKKVIWINESIDGHSGKMGSLEFVFDDSSVKTMRGVLWEDVYAAYNIIYVSKDGQKGNGIGLASASYPNVYNEDKIFDSLIKSNGLTKTEIEYYKYLSNLQKKRKLYLKNVEKDASNLKLFIKEVESFEEIILPKKRKLDGYNSKFESIEVQIQKAKRSKRSSDYYSLLEYASTLYQQYQVDSAAYHKLLDKYEAMVSKEKQLYEQYQHDTTVYFGLFGSNKWDKNSATVKNISKYISNCNKIILHPYIANLTLGRSLIRVDVFPRTGDKLVEQLKEHGASDEVIRLCKKWLIGSDTIGWKFSDDTLLITANNNLIEVRRDRHQTMSETGLLTFNAIESSSIDSTPHFRREFDKVLPTLTEVFHDYYRLNSFTRVMTVMRWAKQSGAKFLNTPKTPPLYKAPAYLIIVPNGEIKLVDM